MSAKRVEVLYVAQQIGGGVIKVGISSQPPARLGTFESQSGHRMEVLGTYSIRDFEAHLHEALAKYRTVGEWFSEEALGVLAGPGKLRVLCDDADCRSEYSKRIAAPYSNKPLRLCDVKGCEKVAMTRGWCPMHYQRWRRYGSVDVETRRYHQNMVQMTGKCGVCGMPIRRGRTVCGDRMSRCFAEWGRAWAMVQQLGLQERGAA